jgi:eukaryotic translation initiation factor 2C
MDSARTAVRVGRNRHFFRPAQAPLGGGLEAWRGYFASVRPVWKTLMVNINVCMTAFVETKNMAHAIMDFQRGSYGATLHLSAMFGKSSLRVKTRHLGHRKGVFSIGQTTANQERFSCEELGGVVTVAQYFQRSELPSTCPYPNIL